MPLLHRLYQLSGLLSALSLASICVLILAQVVARNLGTTVRDAEEFAAWAMAAPNWAMVACMSSTRDGVISSV